MTVTLTASEIFMAAQVGLRRRINGCIMGRQNNGRFDGLNDWNIDIEGACAELAVAKALNRYWSGSVNTFKAPDLTDIQVRWTRYDNGHLIVRDNDPDGETFILVTGNAPTYEIRGWFRGEDAKHDSYKYDESSWRVPQPCLIRMSDFTYVTSDQPH